MEPQYTQPRETDPIWRNVLGIPTQKAIDYIETLRGTMPDADLNAVLRRAGNIGWQSGAGRLGRNHVERAAVLQERDKANSA